MRAASLAGTNFVLENMIAVDEGEGGVETQMAESDALISNLDMGDGEDQMNRGDYKRSIVEIDIGSSVDLFKNMRQKNFDESDGILGSAAKNMESMVEIGGVSMVPS